MRGARALASAIGGKSKTQHVDLCTSVKNNISKMSGARDFVFTRRPEIKRQPTMISTYRPMLRVTVTWCLVGRNSENTDRAPWNSKSHNFRRHLLLFFFIHPSVLFSALFENCIACKSGFIFFGSRIFFD